MSDHATTSQTVGPFFSIGLEWLYRSDLAASDVSGERVEISGQIFDGDGQPVPDAILEIWQANAHGKYAHPDDAQQKPVEQNFSGFLRVPTDENGRFQFTTIKPGRVPGPAESLQAPHLVVSIFTRGLLRRLVTRVYFPGEQSNADDFALSLVEPQRRSTLIANNVEGQPGKLQWNIVLQGAGETVFFDF